MKKYHIETEEGDPSTHYPLTPEEMVSLLRAAQESKKQAIYDESMRTIASIQGRLVQAIPNVLIADRFEGSVARKRIAVDRVFVAWIETDQIESVSENSLIVILLLALMQE